MKVLLFRPNSRVISAPVPLGLGYVAQYLRRRRGDRVEILDARNLRLKPGDVARKLREIAPDVVGISSINMDAREAHEAAARVRAESPRARVVFGGPYASASRGAILKDENVDVVVQGEGEAAMACLLDAWEGDGDASQVPGLWLRQDGQAVFTGQRDLYEPLDDLEPAWDLLNPRAYFKRFGWHTQNRIQRDHRALPIFTTRGCPFRCIYCHNIFGKKFRARSPEKVIEEIFMLKERYGIRELEFLDDCFNFFPDRAKTVMEALIERKAGLHLSFPNGLRGDRVDQEMIDLFKRAGTIRVSYAIETASPRLQKLIRKNLDLDKIMEAIRITAAADIVTVGFFMFGFPTETLEEMEMTVDFALRSDLHHAEFMYLNPFPGTEVAEMAGIDPSDISFHDYHTIPANLSETPDDKMREVYGRAYRKFYLNPRRIVRTFGVMPKNPYFLMNMLLGMRLLLTGSLHD